MNYSPPPRADREAVAIKKLADAAKELAEIANKTPMTDEQAEAITRRSA